jgi:hypothetical protein
MHQMQFKNLNSLAAEVVLMASERKNLKGFKGGHWHLLPFQDGPATGIMMIAQTACPFL